MRLLAALCLAAAPLGAHADIELPDLTDALSAAERGDWTQAITLATPAGDVGADLIQWMRLRDGSGTYAEAVAFLDEHGDWPGNDRIRGFAERNFPAFLPSADILAFFEDEPPVTGEGVIARARALERLGREEEARESVVTAWTTEIFEESSEEAVLEAYGELLEPYHAERVDMLLFRWRVSDAQRIMPRLSDDQRALARARIGYLRDQGGLAAMVDEVPEELRASPGFRYSRFEWLADKGRREEAVEMLEAASVSKEALGEPFRWSGWRRSLARWVMREGDPELAYKLAANHFLEDGSSFADLEWLAGYIALTKLDQPRVALLHFETVERNVWTPISQGRAWYWIGRAQEALGDADAAQMAFTEGGKHQTSFYGLLAAERAGLQRDPDLAGTEDFPDLDEALIAEHPMVGAGLHLLQADDPGLAVLFFAEIGQTLDRETIGSVGEVLAEWDEAYFQVLLGKAAAEQEIVLPEFYFPLHGLAEMDLPTDPALALSIARRESEFRVDAGSHVGALGLMQLMPATAREVAGWENLPYDRQRLTRDWSYNATLGSSYLAYLEERFGYSPAMISAGYNAGPGRPAQWMSQFGDPRAGEIDIVDWVEHIPFRETRNYVMRVTESIPVYQARLAGEPVGPSFTELLTGTKPQVRPEVRPDGSLTAEPVVSTSQTTLDPFPAASALAVAESLVPPTRPVPEGAIELRGVGPAAVAGPPPIRPLSRPGPAGG
ncbi:lytic transglycosylase domain-containing protein [Histidinibacterium aquaticum]|uniref:Lytic transglycosylase domain-containing protein n=1 Tax=Histidinibacterium aquaticum TaxID=2613962 RepID=A0A5J5GD00_9RHOB|nr:lytic transglycosylase domain-containing protein [Histidinibacterium aquaticum]KAA9006066.1 lytic transglycosylase domain-containing protein [Histidinibacterium aquaticum]